MKKVSISINDIKYDAVEVRERPNKCEGCDIFDHCYKIGKGMINVCDIAGRNVIFKKSKEGAEQ